MKIHPATRPLEPAPAPADGALAERPGANGRLDGRIGVALPVDATWREAARVALPATLRPGAVLAGGARAVVQGEESWLLAALDGRVVAEATLFPKAWSDVQLDGARGRFYTSNENGYLAAWRLEDGTPEWLARASGGEDFRRDLIAPLGTRLLLVGHKRATNPHSRVAPTDTRLELLELGAPEVVSEGFLYSRRSVALESLAVAGALVAATSASVVLALPEKLLVFDAATLAKRDELEDADMLPLAFSLDEAGRMYLLARHPDGKTFLELVTPEGERAYSLELEPPVAIAPPVVGFDHRAHVVAGGKLLAVEPSGKVAWEQLLRPAGMAALPGSVLLVAAGSDIVAIDAKGEAKKLASPGGKLVTAPVLTKDGTLLVASEKALHVIPRSK